MKNPNKTLATTTIKPGTSACRGQSTSELVSSEFTLQRAVVFGVHALACRVQPHLRAILTCALLLLTLALLPACGMLGKGTKDAEFKIPEKNRILVFVDPRASCPMPAAAPAQLGELLTQHLFTYKVADNFVDQARLTALRKDDDFRKMGIADVARKTDADIILYLDVVSFATQEVSEGQVSQGNAQVLVKVIDKDGKRLWPPETAVLGAPIEIRVQPNFSEESTPASVQGQLLKLLAIHIGRLFHSYDLEDRNLNQ